MSKKDQGGYPVGNTDPDKRGRGPIGQKIPDKVRKEIEPPDSDKKK